ncbi:hypothetical protein DAMNIGENAA_25160 [Desulforhabdus amnigena]|uniref:Uncharacterized protein n=1 Tax=Desulforhabdus amnigena TaxID=40218 RepID=A0A9W6L7W7_9BACT|nr:hypothetical protein DAMNIGENAA_25160 [Desulforhabdus amnigena]
MATKSLPENLPRQRTPPLVPLEGGELKGGCKVHRGFRIGSKTVRGRCFP